MSPSIDPGLAIANAVTRIHREHYGRGAARARTVMGRDHAVVFLEDIYTIVERTLIDDGKFEAVKQTRHEFQKTLAGAFKSAVEEITGRPVIAFMSETHVNPDIAAEIFVFAPEG